MSERFLVYYEEPMKHRFINFFEASGMSSGEFQASVTRTLLSESRIEYATKKVDGEIKPIIISREGPTGLVTTTTAVSLDPELEIAITRGACR